jgi:succinoglycan biosynthesis protein ExoO
VSADLLVSVVIPAYNAEKTIRNAIDSVLGQTMPNLEVIVVDDASADGTIHAVEAVDDARVRLLRNGRNTGPSASRNMGLKDAGGRWVTFVDADDAWVPERLEHLLAAAGNETDCFVVDWVALCVPDAQGRLTPLELPNVPAQPLTEKFDFTDWLECGMDVTPIVPRAVLGRYGIEFPGWARSGDWLFFFARLFASGVRGRLFHRVGYLYRVTGAHNSSTLRAIEAQLELREFLLAGRDVPDAAKERLRQRTPGIRRRLVLAALREGKWGKFAYYARQNPSDLVWLPRSVLRFLCRQIRYLAASRSTPAVR